MSLFDKLLVAHLIGDWLLQTEWQALNKARNYRALFSHVAVYSTVMLGATLLAGFELQDFRVYLVVALFALSHAFIDLGWPVVSFMKTFRLIVEREPLRWLTMAVDQIFHIVVIAIAAFILLL